MDLSNRKQPFVPCQQTTEAETSAPTMLAIVEREQVGKVELSKHGTLGWGSMIFGSTPEELTKLLKHSLLLFRSTESAAASKG